MSDPKEWFPYEHPVTGRTYVIRYYYEDGDREKKCTVSLKPINPESDEELITSFIYNPDKPPACSNN